MEFALIFSLCTCQAVLRKILGPLFVDVTFPEATQTSSAQKGKPLQNISTPQLAHRQRNIGSTTYEASNSMSKPTAFTPQIDPGESKEISILPNIQEASEARNVTSFDWVIGKLVSGHLSRDILENAKLHMKLAETERLKPTFDKVRQVDAHAEALTSFSKFIAN